MKTSVAGVEFGHCIYNASGPLCVTLDELKKIGESGSAAIMTKSCTAESREGNPEPRYTDIEFGSLNSMGLPNMGYRKYLEYAPELKKYGKPAIVSISGLCKADNIELARTFNKSEYDMIELNLSCPNVPGEPQTGYDFHASDIILSEVRKLVDKPLGVKLPPYFDFVHFQQMAEILNQNKVDFVTCINSIGNALFIDPGKEQVVIRPKKGFGGLGGKYVKPTALANVRKFHELLDSNIDIVGVGGIYNGVDVFEYILCGAKAVQVGTVFMQEGHGVFDRLKGELEDYMEKKDYSSLEDFRGSLKEI